MEKLLTERTMFMLQEWQEIAIRQKGKLSLSIVSTFSRHIKARSAEEIS